MELHPPLHLGIVTIEKGTIWSPSTKIEKKTSCYIHKVLADMSSSFLQVFLVELGSLHGTSNHISYLMQGSLALIPLTIKGYEC